MTALRRTGLRLATSWRRSGTLDRLVIAVVGVLAAALAGAFLFGAWHVLFGGLVRGNPRAAAFGVGLALVSGLALAGIAVVWRRSADRR